MPSIATIYLSILSPTVHLLPPFTTLAKQCNLHNKATAIFFSVSNNRSNSEFFLALATRTMPSIATSHINHHHSRRIVGSFFVCHAREAMQSAQQSNSDFF
jgi:hypothetical protein